MEALGATLGQGSLESLVERCALAGPRRPVALCIGSGLSLPYPSLLPSAGRILTATAAAFAPSARDPADAVAIDAEIESIGRGLPEAYYEMLLDTLGNGVVDVWRAVDLWRDDRLADLSLGPNAGHYAAVLVAARGGVPIVTPNYDLLLEEAARRLGLAPTSGAPSAGAVAIWKLHGTVERLESIRTTLRTITVADWELLDRVRAVFERPGTTLCMIGYSGRDLDFFPHVASWDLDRPFWLDRSFAWEHHAIHRRPGAFRAVEASAAEWGERVVGELLGADLERRGLLAAANADGQTAAAERCDELVRAHAESVARSVPGLDEPRRRLVHALALHATGHDRAAERNVALLLTDPAALGALGPHLRGRLHLLASDVCHELSRYVDSVDHARAAGVAAGGEDGQPHAATLVEARLHVDGGLILQSFGHLPGRSRQILAPRAWSVVARCLATSIVLPLRHRWLRRGMSGRFSQDPAGAATIRASFGYLEHLIRTAAIFQAVIQSWAPFALPALRPWWAWLERRCEAAGYAYGVANARKYVARIGDPAVGASEPSGRDLFLMFAYPTGQALSLRDRGERLRARAERAGGAERVRLNGAALASFEQALAIASAAGNAAVALHSMIGIAGVSDRRFDANEVADLLDTIQSPVYQGARDELLALLCEAR